MRFFYLVFLLLVSFSPLYAEIDMGLGVTGGIQPISTFESQITVSGSIPSIPLYVGAGIVLFDSPVAVNGVVTLDWLMVYEKITDHFFFAFGPGIGVEFPNPFLLGARVPAGLHLFPGKNVKRLELMIEAVPTIIFLGDKSIDIPGFKLPISVGTRIWL